MKTYKTAKSIINHALGFLEDPNHYAIGHLNVCVLPLEDGESYKDSGTPLAKNVKSEQCAYCVLGAIRAFSDPTLIRHSGTFEGDIIRTRAGQFVEDAAWELYPDKTNTLLPGGSYSRAVAVNDGEVHKTIYGAYRATLRVLARAAELAA